MSEKRESVIFMKWFDIAPILRFFSLILCFAMLSACKPTDRVATSAAYINETVDQMESRTPFPTGTPYPTQLPYDTQTPYPDAAVQAQIVKPTKAVPTNTLYPTQTPYPTENPDYRANLSNEIIIMPGLWSRNMSEYGRCGDIFELKIGPRKPVYSYGVEGEISQQQFLLLNVMVRNLTNETIPLIFHKQFKVVGELNGRSVEAVSYGPAGQGVANKYGKAFLGGVNLPPDIEIDAYLGFDIDYHAQNLRLVFESDKDNLNCFFSLPIPEVEFSIDYYGKMLRETEEAR